MADDWFDDLMFVLVKDIVDCVSLIKKKTGMVGARWISSEDKKHNVCWDQKNSRLHVANFEGWGWIQITLDRMGWHINRVGRGRFNMFIDANSGRGTFDTDDLEDVQKVIGILQDVIDNFLKQKCPDYFM